MTILALVIYVLVWLKLKKYNKFWLLYIFCGVFLYIQKLMKSLHNHGSSQLPFVMKMMIRHYLSDSNRDMTLIDMKLTHRLFAA
jgi:low affinity Fe/Cu permease